MSYLGWHFLDATRTLRYDDGRIVRVGETLTTTHATLCVTGLHACARVLDAWDYRHATILCRVALGDDAVIEHDKAVSTSRHCLDMRYLTVADIDRLEAAIAPARTAYAAAVATAGAAYDAAIAPAETAYDAAMALAQTAYAAAVATAGAAYDAALAGAETAYNAVLAPAETAYHAALAKAETDWYESLPAVED